MYSRSNYQTSIWWAEVSIKIVSSIHVLPGAVVGFGRTHGLGQICWFKVHVILILMIQHCSYFNFAIKVSVNLGLDFTNISRRHWPTLSNRHFWSKGQLNDFFVPTSAMISQDFSNCSIIVFKSFWRKNQSVWREISLTTDERTTWKIVYYIRLIRPIEIEHRLSRALIGLFVYR